MEKFVYTHAHKDALYKYRTMKFLFLFLSCLVVLLQSIAWLVVWYRDMPISVSDMVFVGITLASALLFMVSQTFFVSHNKKIIKAIKTSGKFETYRVKMKFSNKLSWAGGFVVFCRILAILFVILLAVLIGNFIENYLNWGKVILKMPFMVICAIGFLNISAELRYQIMLENCK